MKILSVQTYMPAECYEIHFDDGVSLIGDKHATFELQDRIWREVQSRWFRNRESKFAKRGIRRPLRRMTMAKLSKEGVLDSRGRKKYSLQNTEPLQYPQTDLPVPPYVFGLWIGTRSPAGHHWLGDTDFNLMQRKVRRVGFALTKKKAKSGLEEFFIRPGVRESFTFAGTPIPDLIPQSYLEADVDSRLALFDALVDGHDVYPTPVRGEWYSIWGDWRMIRRKQQLIESLGINTKLVKNNRDSNFQLLFRKRRENCAENRRFVKKVQKIQPKQCVHVVCEGPFVAGEGFVAVC